MIFSAKQAAKEVGKSVTTISRAIKSGKLSAQKHENGSYEIEASELFRVFPRKGNAQPVTQNEKKSNMLPLATPSQPPSHAGGNGGDLKELRAQLAQLESLSARERKMLEAQIEDLRQQRDEWRDMASKQQALASKMAEEQALLTSRLDEMKAPRKGFFARLFG
jgi:FtsZ-binding cell division protein ZapB